MEVAQEFYNEELKQQTKEKMKNVLEGFDMQKLKKIHKKALKKEDEDIMEVIKTILIERVVKSF